jgi:phage baseplate assembly protein W
MKTAYVYKDVKPKIHNDQLIGYSDAYDVEAVRNSLLNIFAVQKAEVPGKPWFGNPLRMDIFDFFDEFTETDLESAIVSEVQKFDPRINIIQVKVQEHIEYNRIIVDIYYSVVINGQEVQDHLILPYSHNDRTFIGSRVQIPLTAHLNK